MCMFERQGEGHANFSSKLLDVGKSIFTYKTYLNFGNAVRNNDIRHDIISLLTLRISSLKRASGVHFELNKLFHRK